MKEQEAIRNIEHRIYTAGMIAGNNTSGTAFQDLEMAIKALKEIQQYRAIGTIAGLQALKEKSVAKKPNYEGDGYYNGELVLDTWICPNCEKSYEVDYDDYEYCPNCGQHIDHSSLTEDD